MEQPFISQEEKKTLKLTWKHENRQKASYGSLDTSSIKRNENRQRKASKEISEQSSSSVLQSQDTSDIPLDASFSSDLEVEPVNEPNKRSHKRVVKTGVELFLTADFILHEKLVASVRRTNISLANLVTFFSPIFSSQVWYVFPMLFDDL